MKPHDDSKTRDFESSRRSGGPNRDVGIGSTQFRVLDLFTVMTLSAVAFAILVPMLRYANFEQLVMGLVAVAVQLSSAITTYVALGVRRRRMMAGVGMRIGIAFSGEIPWKYWPVVRCALTLVIVGLVQFIISLFFVFKLTSLYAPILLIYSLQLGYFFGASLSQFHWRSYPGVVEFYESGITTDGRSMTPWNRVEARKSQIYKDRIVLVSDATNISGSRTTHTVRLTEQLRNRLQAYVDIKEGERVVGSAAGST